MQQRKVVRAQVQQDKPLAVVYDGAALEGKLADFLKKEGLRVMEIKRGEFFPVLSVPQYVFFFAKGGVEELKVLREALVTGKRNGAKMLICLDNLSVESEKMVNSEIEDSGWPVKRVEIRGVFERSGDEVYLAAEKIVRLVFSSGRSTAKLLLVGRKLTVASGKASYTSNISDKLGKYGWGGGGDNRKSRIRWRTFLTAISLLVIILFLPLFVSLVLAAWGGLGLRDTERNLIKGNYELAKKSALEAQGRFDLAGKVVSSWQFVWRSVGVSEVTEKYYNSLFLAQRSSEVLSHAAGVAKNIKDLSLGMGGEGFAGTLASISEARSGLSAMERELLLIEAQWPQVSGTFVGLAPILGISREKLLGVGDSLLRVKELVAKAQEFLRVLPEITGEIDGGKRKYLVVLQNSSELRPTGGFIGSYAILDFDSGRFLGFKINDIYSADGQLKGRIQPPDEILHFLGQPSWYMRDANWAADWPLTAQRLEWFFEKETGEKVDGVWAVSLPAVQKLLAATGPLTLAGFGGTVSGTDFYQKAEYASEINFFPGSTQKKDFLGATAQALWEKITGDGEKDLTKLARAVGEAFSAKDIMMFSNKADTQVVIEEVGWGGSIVADHCGDRQTNCLAVVEANMGANKANYFVKRAIKVNVLVGKEGELENRVTVTYENDSPSESWPGGTYKNYVRFLVPVDVKMTGFDVGDGRKPKLSGILTADILRQTSQDQFLVFNNLEFSEKSKNATGSAFLAFGTYVEIIPGTTKTVSFSFRPGYRMNFSSSAPVLDMTILKQPGTGEDPLSVMVDYPSFLLAEVGNIKGVLVFDQKLAYTTILSQDRKVQLKFLKVLK